MAAITLIGSGNTATALGKALIRAGHSIAQVWSRDEEHAKTLGDILGTNYTADISNVTKEADIYLVTVRDDAIESVAGTFSAGDKIVAHTSGIRSKDLLQIAGPNYGIFYPNVSMTKGVEVDFTKVLLMIEGSNEDTVASLKSLADTITSNARIVDEKQRQSFHVASVFANNFTNRMYIATEQILLDSGMSFEDIRPLIASHLQTLMQQSPTRLQTGPAIRHDETAIDSHLRLIQRYPALHDIYINMTSSIQEWQKTNS